MIPDLAIYDSGVTIEQTLSPIRELTYVAIIDFVTGLETEVDLSNCTVASGGLSFTNATDLSDNDLVYFEYDTDKITTKYDYGYYDSRVVFIDTDTGTVYKVVRTVTSGEIVDTLVEVV
jgi:hypothetical protein